MTDASEQQSSQNQGRVDISGGIVVGPVIGHNEGTVNYVAHPWQPRVEPDSKIWQPLLDAMPLNSVPDPAPFPPFSRMPYTTNPHFVGRDEVLVDLAKALKGGGRVVLGPRAAATGLGGIGKTSVAAEFVHRYAQYFAGGVFWLSCADPAAVSGEVVACGGPGLLDLHPTFGTLKLDEQVRLVRQSWQHEVPRLLIFDNCEDPTLVEAWAPATGGCRVLITSRRQRWPSPLRIQAQRLAVLVRPSSIALLQQLAPRLTDSEADAISKELGDLPLALLLAGNFLSQYGTVKVEYYLQELKTNILNTPALQGRGSRIDPTRHDLHVWRTFDVSYNQLTANTSNTPIDALAILLLARAAWLAPGEPIPTDLLLASLPPTPDDLDKTDALIRVVDLGFLTTQDAVVVMHRLVHAFVQAKGIDASAQTDVEHVLGNCLEAINADGDLMAMQPLLAHLYWVTRHDASGHDIHSRIRLICLLVLGGYPQLHEPNYFDVYGHSAPLLDRIDNIIPIIRSLGKDYAPILHFLLSKQGNAAHDHHNFDKAYDAYEEAFQTAPSLDRKIRLQAVLGRVANKLGNIMLAQQWLESAHELAKTSDEDMALSYVLEVRSEYAGLHHNHEQAYTFACEAVTLARAWGDQVRLCFALINCGTAALYSGRLQEAIDIHAEVMQLAYETRYIQLQSHAHRSNSEVSLAQGDTAAARKHLEAALEFALACNDRDNADAVRALIAGLPTT